MISLNSFQIVPTVFPDGTSQVWKIPEEYLTDDFRIIWEFENEAEIFHLIQLVDILKWENLKGELRIPYLPYARQDKRINNLVTFALYPFAELINGMSLRQVSVFDPHSFRALELIDNLLPEYPDIANLFKRYDHTLICYPDAGAKNKYALINGSIPSVYAEKSRDPLSGRITSLELSGNVKGESILIEDDICDGGATFILLAKQLFDNGAKVVDLYVSHGIFSRGKEVLHEAGIRNIFTKEDL